MFYIMLVIFLSFEGQHQRYMLFLIHMARSFRFGIMSVDDKSVWSNGCRWNSRSAKSPLVSCPSAKRHSTRNPHTHTHTHTLVDTPRTRLPTRQVSILGTSKCKSARPAVQPLWLEFYLVKCCFYSNSSWVYFSITFLHPLFLLLPLLLLCIIIDSKHQQRIAQASNRPQS